MRGFLALMATREQNVVQFMDLADVAEVIRAYD